MNCPSCEAQLPDDAVFCGQCGQPLGSGRSCPSCGRSNPLEMRFCLDCGHRLDDATASPERAPRDYTPKHLADKILQSKSALEGERKQVTVLFADVKGAKRSEAGGNGVVEADASEVRRELHAGSLSLRNGPRFPYRHTHAGRNGQSAAGAPRCCSVG